MEIETFQPGDIVILKSLGPILTVEQMDSAAFVKCFYWNEVKGEFLHITILTVLLRKAT